MIRRIQLVNSNEYTLVDEETYQKYKDLRLFRSGNGYVTYYCKVSQQCRQFSRLLLNPGTLEVDHINRNPLDNRLCNLRTCTRSDNNRNRMHSKLGTSGFRGVQLTPSGKYSVRITTHPGTKVRVGLFRSKYDAVIYYNLCVQEYYGSYAVPNVLSTVTPELYYTGLEH